jgi:periplasmic divalent cation tolerance protein
MSKFIKIITTVEKIQDAERIVKNLLEKRLAGCTQIIGPIKSTYWWKGNIETSQEYLVFIKSRQGLYEEIENSIKENHPYETPEIICIPILMGSKEYFQWLEDELK